MLAAILDFLTRHELCQFMLLQKVQSLGNILVHDKFFFVQEVGSGFLLFFSPESYLAIPDTLQILFHLPQSVPSCQPSPVSRNGHTNFECF